MKLRYIVMSIISQILITAVALEFFFIFYLETFATTSARTAKVFNLTPQDHTNSSLITLFKNQGVYNGLLGLLLLYAAFISAAGTEIAILLLAYIIAVAAYGSLTSNKWIILKQGGLAIVALLSLIII